MNTVLVGVLSGGLITEERTQYVLPQVGIRVQKERPRRIYNVDSVHVLFDDTSGVEDQSYDREGLTPSLEISAY